MRQVRLSFRTASPQWNSAYSNVRAELFETILAYTQTRDLDADRIVEGRDAVEETLYTYIASQHLQILAIEVSEPAGGQQDERNVLEWFEITHEGPRTESPTDPDAALSEGINDDLTAFKEELQSMESLPAENRYSLFVGLRRDHTEEPPRIEATTDAEPAVVREGTTAGSSHRKADLRWKQVMLP